jgi:hypothetical protein
MSRVTIDNLGIPPLAGLCSYEEACRIGYDVDHNVALLKRYVFSASMLNQIFAAHLASTPEWEVKCGFSLHMWLVAEHSASLRKRVTEMREPPLHLDKVPDDRLKLFFDEVIRAESTLELLIGVYVVSIREWVRAVRKHLEETNPLVDHPTCRLLRFILGELEDMLTWGEQAVQALIRTDEDRRAAAQWEKHLLSLLHAAEGISGDLPKPQDWQEVIPRADGRRFEMDACPRRDSRFTDPYNKSAEIDRYVHEPSRPSDERSYALLYKRLREMDVPEWMGPIIYKTQGKPWEYYVDMSRQCWDEARHSMLGEVGLYQNGVPFYKYPIEFMTSEALNTGAEPLDAHIVLWHIEQSLMPKDTGKRFEWVVAMESNNRLAGLFQDYDWADEVLHAQIGRKWLLPLFDHNLGELTKIATQTIIKNTERKKALAARSDQKEWWPQFVEDMRKGHHQR